MLCCVPQEMEQQASLSLMLLWGVQEQQDKGNMLSVPAAVSLQVLLAKAQFPVQRGASERPQHHQARPRSLSRQARTVRCQRCKRSLSWRSQDGHAHPQPAGLQWRLGSGASGVPVRLLPPRPVYARDKSGAVRQRLLLWSKKCS